MTARAAGPVVQRAYVAFVQDSSGTDTYTDSQATILARVDAALGRWQALTGGRIGSFARVGAVATVEADCTQSTSDIASRVWAQSGTVFPGVDFSTYDPASGNHFIVIAPTGCAGGEGYEGEASDQLQSGGKVIVTDNPAYGEQSLMHELGHNFGLEHSHSLDCTTSGSCTTDDYGDYYDFMGATLSGTPAWIPPALNSFQRTRLGIAEPCEVQSDGLPSGQASTSATYDLFGRGQDTGNRGVKITAPDGTVYWLDWRNHAGLDASAGYGTSGYSKYIAGVTVSEQTPGAVDASGVSTTVLGHYNAAGNYRYAYVTGETFSGDGVSVHVDATSPSSDPGATAQVTVSIAGTGIGTPSQLPFQTGGATEAGGSAVGAILTAGTAGWTSGSCDRYQWLRDGTPIDGARSASYTTTAADDGHQVSVQVTGQHAGYQPRTATSNAVLVGGQATTTTSTPPGTTTTTTPQTTTTTAPGTATSTTSPGPATTTSAASSSGSSAGGSGAALAQSGSVSIAGVPGIGAILRAAPRAWTPGASFVYRWYEDGRVIPGARGSTLRLSSAMRGHRITAAVAGVHAGYATRVAVAPVVLVGRFTARPRLWLLGPLSAGGRLRAQLTGRWSPRPRTIRYRWSVNGRLVRYATGRTLLLTPTSARARVTVIIRAVRPGFTPLTIRTSRRAR